MHLRDAELLADLGPHFDAEMARERAILCGRPPFEEPRVTRSWSEEDRRAMGATGPTNDLRTDRPPTRAAGSSNVVGHPGQPCMLFGGKWLPKVNA
ncbi:hypothetical protein AB0O39_38040 [Streptomyces anulatus]|uniref:hypothetical protein n=1 Tax=Streptomyces anulatus TaxID=1892 RepID=UPI0034495A29